MSQSTEKGRNTISVGGLFDEMARRMQEAAVKARIQEGIANDDAGTPYRADMAIISYLAGGPVRR